MISMKMFQSNQSDHSICYKWDLKQPGQHMQNLLSIKAIAIGFVPGLISKDTLLLSPLQVYTLLSVSRNCCRINFQLFMFTSMAWTTDMFTGVASSC